MNANRAIQYNFRDAVNPKYAEAELDNREEIYHYLAEFSSDIVAVISEERFVYVNYTGAKIFGVTNSEEVIGKSLREILPQEDSDFLLKQIRCVLEKEQLRRFEYSLQSDKTKSWFDSKISPMSHNSVIWSAHDITKYKHAEQKKIRQKDLQNDISAVLRLKGPLNEILQQYAQVLLQNFNLALIRIWTSNKDKNALELFADAGLITDLKENYARISIGDTEIGKIAEQHKAYLTNDAQNDSRISHQEWIKNEGIVAFAGYPLMIESRLAGVMAVFARVTLTEDIFEELAALADDITQIIERKRLEETLAQNEIKLRQFQRLESVGKWAGGIAHDFNNMLTVINGYSELSLRRLRKDGLLRSNIEEIKKAGERSALLTYQLLVFSRQQSLKPEKVNLNEVIGEIDSMLHRLISKDIQLNIHLDNNLGYVKADWEQLSHLIMNLVVNARDAMPHGGTLTIETKNFIADEKSEKFTEQDIQIKPGNYINLLISDAGAAIDKPTQRHTFETFYNSKESNSVNGLGLAVIHDIVKQAEGYIFADSENGNGTTFKIYLPQVNKESKLLECGSAFKQLSQQNYIRH